MGVSVLCPELVKTPLVARSQENRPKELETGAEYQQAPLDADSGISPMLVGEQVIDAVRDNQFYILTHDDYRDCLKMRHDGIIDAMDRHAERYGSTSGLSS